MNSKNEAYAESGLLAAMLCDPACIPKIETMVIASDFHCVNRSDLFTMLCHMHTAGESIRDTALVLDRIRSSGLLARIGGAAALAKLANAAAGYNADVYATEVRRQSVKRSTLKLANRLRSKSESSDPVEVVQWLRAELDLIESRSSVDTHVSTIGEACRDLVRSITATQLTGELTGVPTGIDHIDLTYGGLFPGRLYVIAARPGVGKTSLAQQSGEAIAASNESALFVSLEMSRAEIAGRYLSRTTGINGKAINSHSVTGDQLRLIGAAADAAVDLPFIVSEPKARNSTLAAISAEIRRHKATDNIAVAIIDYLQIIEPAHARETEYERFTAASRSFKQLSRELKIPVVLLSQLNRGSEKDKPREPRMSDLRGTGAIEQDADGVMLLHDVGEGQTKLIVPKMRGGERSTALMSFDGPTCTFSTPPIEDHPNYSAEFADGAW